jgi:hypothetical protein
MLSLLMIVISASPKPPSSDTDSSSVVALIEQFCSLEMKGSALDDRTSEPLLRLTVGEEEPFMGDSEIVTGCKLVKGKIGASTGTATVQYEVKGRIVENAQGMKSVLRTSKRENIRLKLMHTHDTWKIENKSLMFVAQHATAAAWASHFETLIEPDDAKKTQFDRNLDQLIGELQQIK